MKRLWLMGCLAGLLPNWVGAAPAVTAVTRWVFTDESWVLKLTEPPAAVDVGVRVQDETGLGPETKARLAITDGQAMLKPLAEGLHVVTLGPPYATTLRLLAVDPPAAVDREKVAARLPLGGRRLLDGKPYTVVVLTDQAAWWEELLAGMLTRATGNRAVTAASRAYPPPGPGKALCASGADVARLKPALAVLAFGQAETPLETWLEEHQRLATHLRNECRADTVLAPLPADVERGQSGLAAALRAAEGLRTLAPSLSAALAETIPAAWAPGAAELGTGLQRLRARAELGADGLPGALAAVRVARAVWQAVSGLDGRPPLRLEAVLRWTSAGVRARLSARNVSATARRGQLRLCPLPDEELLPAEPIPYALEPDESLVVEVSWPRVRTPGDLLRYPASRHLARGRPLLALVDTTGETSRPCAVVARFEVDAAFLRRRLVCDDGVARLPLDIQGRWHERAVSLPREREVGSLGIVEPVLLPSWPDRVGWAVAEAAWLRYGAAIGADATPDGDLSEWRSPAWSPLGEPCQARGPRGTEDQRTSPAEASLRLAFRAGRKGLHVAMRGVGDLTRDTFTILLDPRTPAQLGTVGRFYWLIGKLLPDGKVELLPGETTPRAQSGWTGAWRQTAEGLDLEVFVPYGVCETNTWPVDGDLGFDLRWSHHGADGRITHLHWFGDGYPWTPRGFGVVRLVTNPAENRPWLVRMR